MTSPFPPSVEEIVSTFEELEDWNEKYEFLVDLGRELPELDAELQTTENQVRGCMSTVWMVARLKDVDPKTVELLADSDSLIVKGLIVVVLSVFSGRTPETILKEDVTELFDQLGLSQHLSANRRNGLFAMVKRVKQLAAEHASVAP